MTEAIAKAGGEFPWSVERRDDLMLNASRAVRSCSSGSVQLGKCTYRSKYHRYITYDGLHDGLRDGLWGLTNSHQLCSTLGHSAAQAGRPLRATACGAGALALTPGAQLVLTSVQALKCAHLWVGGNEVCSSRFAGRESRLSLLSQAASLVAPALPGSAFQSDLFVLTPLASLSSWRRIWFCIPGENQQGF